MKKQDVVWQGSELTQTYLTGIRGAIPLAQEQIDVMQRLVRAACPNVKSVLDLGCGDGILGQAILDEHVQAFGVFADFSGPMLEAARTRLDGCGRCSFVDLDYGKKSWQDALPSGISRFEVIVSGFSIHHQPDQRKKELYAELYELLNPGGIFLNLEHVASRSPWVELRFEELFIDALYAYQQKIGSEMSRQEVDEAFYSRPDKEANILTAVETQCDWLREIGFIDVDCYLKVFELALFGGVK